MGDKDTGSAVYNIVAFCFDGQETAKQTLKEAKNAGALEGYDIVVQAIVEQNEKGKVHLKRAGQGRRRRDRGRRGGRSAGPHRRSRRACWPGRWAAR